ncbi:UNVERIFIED_CONTAM: hypothetical protein Slati_0509900 [Sesamum latifolium]|uniref:DDE Tnp4 domain-containing protein n=1 Tax=Sesamum latifolium TaxID=2727402 RepID=A0AAW2XXS1_9LAMI
MRSARTVSQHFHHVLTAVLRLGSLLLAKPVPVSADSSCARWKWFEAYVTGKCVSYMFLPDGKVVQRMLECCVTRLVGLNGLKIPRGNYYLVDSGYSNGEGFLSPYRGVRYHLKEWDSGRNSPQNHEEFFNMKHASARNVIERTFGLLKARWAILQSPAFYSIKVQNRIIMACCLLHNYIRQEMTDDPIEQLLTDEGLERRILGST